MAVTLQKYLNSKLKEKGLSVKEAKKNAGKYKSIAAAKKAGSLYYTNKDGKVMAAVYAGDLKKPIKDVKPKKKPLRSSPFPKTRPSSGSVKIEVLVGSIPKKTIEKAIEQGSSAQQYTKFFNKNKNKYKKPNGGFDHSKALKDFNKMRSN